MKRLAFAAAVAAMALGFTVSDTQQSQAQIGIFIGPTGPGVVVGPKPRHCRWEVRRGNCYRERVCTRWQYGQCVRLQWKKVCQKRRVRVCY